MSDDEKRARSPPRSERRRDRRRRRARRDLHRALGYYYHPAAAAGQAMGHTMCLDSYNRLAVCPVVPHHGAAYGLAPAYYHPSTTYGMPYYPTSNAFVECDNGEGESRVLTVGACALAQEHADVFAGCSSVLNTDAQVEQCVRAYTMFRH